MAKVTPWMTSNSLIEAVKRKMSLPLSQSTYSTTDILAFASEEMSISLVAEILSYHSEYFVFRVDMPLVSGKTRYQIPNRAIGMKMRDLFYKDTSGNVCEMTQVSSNDKSQYQYAGTNAYSLLYYLEGNDVVLMSDTTGSGSLQFNIFLRPNQLVPNERACIAQNFTRTITVSNVQLNDQVTIGDLTFTAKTVTSDPTDFFIGVSDTATATYLSNALNANGINASTGSPATNVVTTRYDNVNTKYTQLSTNLLVQTSQGIEFDQVPSTYLDLETNITSDLYLDGEEIDFLQTKPGHRTYSYDVKIPINGIAGNIISFNAGDVPSNFLVGDYICLANECIIPQVPPDLHTGLAERTCTRILAALGDQEGMQASMVKVAEIQKSQGTLLSQRVEGSPLKVSGRRGLLGRAKRGPWSY